MKKDKKEVKKGKHIINCNLNCLESLGSFERFGEGFNCLVGASKQERLEQNKLEQSRTQQDVLKINKINHFNSFNSFFESKKSMFKPTAFLFIGLFVFFGLLGLLNITRMNFVFALPENVTDVEKTIYLANLTKCISGGLEL